MDCKSPYFYWSTSQNNWHPNDNCWWVLLGGCTQVDLSCTPALVPFWYSGLEPKIILLIVKNIISTPITKALMSFTIDNQNCKGWTWIDFKVLIPSRADVVCGSCTVEIMSVYAHLLWANGHPPKWCAHGWFFIVIILGGELMAVHRYKTSYVLPLHQCPNYNNCYCLIKKKIKIKSSFIHKVLGSFKTLHYH